MLTRGLSGDGRRLRCIAHWRFIIITKLVVGWSFTPCVKLGITVPIAAFVSVCTCKLRKSYITKDQNMHYRFLTLPSIWIKILPPSPSFLLGRTFFLGSLLPLDGSCFSFIFVLLAAISLVSSFFTLLMDSFTSVPFFRRLSANESTVYYNWDVLLKINSHKYITRDLNILSIL